MEGTVKVLPDPTSPNGTCINDPSGKITAVPGFKMCEVGNNPLSSGSSNAREDHASQPRASSHTAHAVSASSQENNIASETVESSLRTKKLILEANFARLKVTADESARLDAQHQQVQRLIANQASHLNHLKAESTRNRELQASLQQRLQTSFQKQQQISNQAVSNSVLKTKNNLWAAATRATSNCRAAGMMSGPTEKQAKEIAEHYRREHEGHMREIEKKNEEYQRQLDEAKRQEEEHQRQLNEYQRQLSELETRDPLFGAERRVEDNQKGVVHQEHEKGHAEQQLRESEQHLEHHRQRYDQVRNDYEQRLNSRLSCRGILSFRNADWLREERDRELSGIQAEINRLQDAINHRRGHLDHCRHKLHEAHQKKSLSESHLRHVRENLHREQEIKIAQDKTLIVHLQAVEDRREEALTRLNNYNQELETINILVQSLTIDQELSKTIHILKDKRVQTEIWSKETQDRLKLQNDHLTMINNHFEHCINEIKKMDLEDEAKRRLAKRWDELKHLELTNKKIIINISNNELDNLKTHLQFIERHIANLNRKVLLAEYFLTKQQTQPSKMGESSVTQELSPLNVAHQILKDGEILSTEVLAKNALPSSQPSATITSQALTTIAAGISRSTPAAGNIAGQLRNAVTALSRAATATPAGAMATVAMAALLPTKMGDGSLQGAGGRRFTHALPAAALNIPDETSLHRALKEQHTVDIPIRGRLVSNKDAMRIELVRTARPSPVLVVAGIPDGKGHYLCTVPANDDLPARTILVNPANAPGVGGLGAIITPDDGPQAVAHAGGQTQPVNLPTITAYPGLDESDFNDLIVVPPLESGDEPIYVMFSGPRDQPGVVTGQGQKVGENWLAEAATESGAPIPEQIADKLRDKNYSSFDAFRGEFWKNVSKDKHLTKNFNLANKLSAEKGLAPFSPVTEHVGSRGKYELHHIKPIAEGGEVYDINNMAIMTPKLHIKQHSKEGGS